MLSVGIVGLPNAGKSLLFNTITNLNVPSENYPFCTIEPNSGKVEVIDDRFDKLVEVFNPKKQVRSVIEFTDIAGIIKGAAEGAGLGNKFLSHIREVDLVLYLLRAFEDKDVIHTETTVDAVRDFEILRTELNLSDIETCQKRYDKLSKEAKSNPEAKLEAEKLNELIQKLNGLELIDGSKYQEYTDLNLFCLKPFLVALNIADSGNAEEIENTFSKNSGIDKSKVIALAVKLENEVSSLSYDERRDFYESINNYRGLPVLTKICFNNLNMVNFFTAGEDEVRSWDILKYTKAPQAAGKIHTDFEKKFIRAAVISWKDLVEFASFARARESGKVRTEGKEYVVQDGDVLEIFHG